MEKNKVKTSVVCAKQQSNKWCKIPILLLVVAFGASAFYSYDNRNAVKNIEHELVACKEENQKEIESLKKEIRELKTYAEENTVKKKQEQCSYSHSEHRNKWKIWMALRKRMESGEPFDSELEAFNNAFAEDAEILVMVENLAKGVDVISISESDELIETCKKYLRKIVRLKKINQKKLVEISGYVLSSVGCCSNYSAGDTR